VNDITSQNELLSDCKFIQLHILLNQTHIDYLKKIDKDNISKSVRILIETYMKQKKMLSFEKYLTTFAFGLALVGIGTILPNLYISLASMGTGAFCILFSLAMYSRSRIKYEKGE
jgi:hypothetical protein